MAFFSESLLLDLLGTVTALVVIFYAYIKWSYQYWERSGVPYLEPSIPFGNLENPSKRTVSIGSDLARVYRQMRAKGWKHGGAYIMTSPNWVILDLDLIKHVMTKDFHHFMDRGAYYNERDDPLSAHLFSIGGSKWRNLRTKLSPTFTSGKMKTMFQTVIDCGLVLEKYVERMSNKEGVDIKEVLGCFSTDVIGSCAFGLECNSFTEPDAQFRKYGKKILERTKLQAIKFSFCINYPDLARSLRITLVEKDVSDFFMKAVGDTVKYREENNHKRKDFLQLLIDIKSNKDTQENGHEGCFSTDVIGSCAFGLECNSFTEPDAQFRKYGKKILERTKLQAIKFSFCINYPDLARSLRITLVEKDVSDFFMKAVGDTVKYREENNHKRKDFLQLLIDIKSNKDTQENGHEGDGTTLTMNEIAAQSFVFFIAGFETSSTTMTFALYELASHQGLQERVRKEINEVLAKHDNQITYDSLSELKYMKQVIDETLRMYPPVPLLTRRCVEDYKVPDEDIIIEKGTKVLIPILGIHYDEEYYKDPHVFDPDRFNEESKAQRHHYAHLPFGEGPRICIGERFGIMQTKVGLTCILRNFRVKVNGKTQVPLKMDVKSFLSAAEGGIWLDLEKL